MPTSDHPWTHPANGAAGVETTVPLDPPITLRPTVRGTERLRVSVVIPALNEERNIGWVLRRIPDSVDEVVLIDGLSRDATIEVARMIMPQVVVVHELTPGKGSALRAGFEAASGDVVIMLDADASMDPAEIPAFVRVLEDGYDVAKGSRFLPGARTDDMTLLRHVGNAGLLRLANFLYRTSHTDLCYGYLGFRRSALASLQADAPGFEIEMQLVARMSRAGLQVGEVASHEFQRMHGASNLRTFRDGFRVLWTMLRESRWRPREAQPRPAPPLRAR